MKSILTTDYLLPVRVVEANGKITNEQTLLKQKSDQIGLGESDFCTVEGKGYIVLDFGKEYAGGARILVGGITPANPTVRLRFGESLSEVYAELGEKNAGNDHSIRDFSIPLTMYSDMTFGQTGYRFLRIDFPEDCTVYIKSIYLAYTHREFSSPRPFKTSDGRIAQIYDVAKRTIELCCQNYLWDGIKRDRLVWVGDIHPEMLALTALYGRTEIIEEAMDYLISITPKGAWMNTMPMYSAWSLIILADYAVRTGAYDFAEKHAGYIKDCLEQISACVLEDGTLSFPGYFVDWPTHEQVDELDGCRAILEIMTDKLTELYARLSLDDAPVRALYERLCKENITVRQAKQVVALKYLATGSLAEEDVRLITDGGAKGMSTFMSYYVLKTVAESYSVDYAINMMKDYYGAMLDKGATSFFEDFDMDWVENSCRIDELPKEGQRDVHGDFGKYCYQGFRHSLCHGWSSGVIEFLYEYCNEAK